MLGDTGWFDPWRRWWGEMSCGEYAALALASMKNQHAIKTLIDLLGNQNHNEQKSCVYGLERITGKRFGKDHAKWQRWWTYNKNNVYSN